MKGSKGAPIPAERRVTVRKEIEEVLRGGRFSAREISTLVRVSEREVYGHLGHIQRAAHKGGYQLNVTPAECKGCGFVFRKRDRLTRPGRCPVCHGGPITEPLFSISP